MVDDVRAFSFQPIKDQQKRMRLSGQIYIIHSPVARENCNVNHRLTFEFLQPRLGRCG